MTMQLKEFKKRFADIKSKKFVRSLRRGPTGVGYTFETMLGLAENNLALPDIPKTEIKAHREGTSSLITLFTFNRKAWQMPPLEAIGKYGSYDDNDRKGLYYTVSPTPNSAGLFLFITDEILAVRHTSGEDIVAWQMSELEKRFEQKIPGLLFISAHVEVRADVEWFHFYRARLMRGTSSELLKNLFIAGDLLIDLRLHDSGTRARNHGTGFRISENKLPRLFKNIKDIA